MIAIIGSLFATQALVHRVAHASEVGIERLSADMIIVPIGGGRRSTIEDGR